MNDLLNAAEAAAGLLCGGILFLLFGSALGATGLINLSLWGIIYIFAGVVGLIVVVAAAVGAIISGGVGR